MLNATDAAMNLVEPDTEPAPSRKELFMIIGLLTCVGLVGTVGNALVLYLLSKKKEKMVSTLFILVLAITDFLTCAALIPVTIYMEYVDLEISSDFMCRAFNFGLPFSIPFSAMIMSAIAIHRYFCICHPLLHLFTMKKTIIIIICLALIALCFGVVASLMHSVYHPSDNRDATELFEYHGFCTANFTIFSWTFIWYYNKLIVALLSGCVIIVIVFYALICRSVLTTWYKHKQQRSNDLPMIARATDGNSRTSEETIAEDMEEDTTNGMRNDTHNEGWQRNKKEGKTSKEETKRKKSKTEGAEIKLSFMFFVVTVVFIASYLPFFLMVHQIVQFNVVAMYLFFVNFAANPVIYIFMNQSFRNDLRKLFCRQTN